MQERKKKKSEKNLRNYRNLEKASLGIACINILNSNIIINKNVNKNISHTKRKQ